MYTSMYLESYLLDAINFVISSDIPEECISDAVSAQACLMARVNQDEVISYGPN